VVDGVPLTTVRAVSGDGRLPGAVVVHGFAGSARLMQPFADTLARNGYVVVLPDLAGHGSSTRPIADPGPDVEVAVRSLLDRSDVDHGRIVLIGHSRGAAAVTAYAATHPEIAATVAVSGAAPVSVPRNLLMLYGQFEFPLLAAAAEEMLLRGDPTATVTTGYTYGSFADGSARRADPVPGVEHVSILFSPTAHAWTLAWIDAAVRPGAPPGAVHSLDRLWPSGLLLLGLLLGFVPLAVLVLRRTGTRPSAPRVTDLLRPGFVVSIGLGAGAVVGAIAPDPVLGLSVGGYTAMVLLAFGLTAAIGLRWVAPRPAATTDVSMLGRTPLLTVFVTMAVLVPMHVGLTHAVPSLARLVPLVVLLVAGWVLFGVAEQLSGGRWYLHAAVLAAPLGVLVALAVVGLGPGFLVLVLPLLAGLLAIGAVVAAVLRRRAVPPWLIAAVAAPPFAWTAAVTLPLA
jgi:pimeloyl-ACP methyl ester carboxylesterase